MATLAEWGREQFQPIQDLRPDQLVQDASPDRHSVIYAVAHENGVNATREATLYEGDN